MVAMAYLVARTTVRRRRVVNRLVRQSCASAWAGHTGTGDAASRRVRASLVESLRTLLHGRCDPDVVDEAITTAILRDEVALLHRVDRDLLHLVAEQRIGLAAAADRLGIRHGHARERITSGLLDIGRHDAAGEPLTTADSG